MKSPDEPMFKEMKNRILASCVLLLSTLAAAPPAFAGEIEDHLKALIQKLNEPQTLEGLVAINEDFTATLVRGAEAGRREISEGILTRLENEFSVSFYALIEAQAPAGAGYATWVASLPPASAKRLECRDRAALEADANKLARAKPSYFDRGGSPSPYNMYFNDISVNEMYRLYGRITSGSFFEAYVMMRRLVETGVDFMPVAYIPSALRTGFGSFREARMNLLEGIFLKANRSPAKYVRFYRAYMDFYPGSERATFNLGYAVANENHVRRYFTDLRPTTQEYLGMIDYAAYLQHSTNPWEERQNGLHRIAKQAIESASTQEELEEILANYYLESLYTPQELSEKTFFPLANPPEVGAGSLKRMRFLRPEQAAELRRISQAKWAVLPTAAQVRAQAQAQLGIVARDADVESPKTSQSVWCRARKLADRYLSGLFPRW